MSSSRSSHALTPRQGCDPQLCALAEDVVAQCLRAGADDAEAVVYEGSEFTAQVRKGELDLLKEASSRALGIRVIRRHRVGSTSTNDLNPDTVARLVKDTLDLTSFTEPDPYQGLPDAVELCTDAQDLDLHDGSVGNLSAAQRIEMALTADAAARDFDRRISSTDGTAFASREGQGVLANSLGFTGGYRRTYQYLVAEAFADDEGGKKRNGSWWDGARFLSELPDPKSIGAEAARRTLRQLGARKPQTMKAPAVFSPEAARQLIGLFVGCATGGALYRKSTYLVDKEGHKVASDLLHLVDDPFLRRGPGSRPFDDEGVRSRRQTVVEAGVLRTFLFDTYSGRKLGRKTTGSASRSLAGTPGASTSNLLMTPGKATPEELIADVKQGIYIEHLMGHGFNGVTGDFSKGAGGMWIENGKLTYPVEEATVSANFNDLLAAIDGVANDLDRRSSLIVPTLRVREVMIGGR
jgi:PmbA protein